MKKVGVFLETSYYLEYLNGSLYCQDIYSLLFNSISDGKFNFSFIGRKVNSLNKSFYLLNNNKFYTLSNYRSIISLLKNFPLYIYKNRLQIKQFINDNEQFIISIPSPLSIPLIRYIKKNNKKFTLLVRQNSNAIISRYSGINKILAIIIIKILERLVKYYIRKTNASILVLGNELYDMYKKISYNVVLFSSSRYRLNDVIKIDQIKPINWSGIIKFIYVGRLENNKGVNNLIIALNNIRDYKWCLDIIGEGSYKMELKALVEASSLSSNINFRGYIPFGNILLDEYLSHDIFVLPSYSEGLSQSVLEAMARGCLVLASEVGGLKYIIKNKVNGFHFNPHSRASIIDLLKSLIDIDTKSIRINALSTAKEFAYENQISKLLDVLNKKVY